MLEMVVSTLLIALVALGYAAWRATNGLDKAILIQTASGQVVLLIAVLALWVWDPVVLDVALIYALASWIYSVVYYYTCAKDPEEE